MGRFLNSRAVAAAPSRVLRPPNPPPQFSTTSTAAATAPPPVAQPPDVSSALAGPVATSPFARIGLYALCAYLISGYATDLSYRFLGTKPYVSMIAGVLMIGCFLISGRAQAALRSTVGKLWLAIGIWMCIAVIFSRWRGGSFELMQLYIPKQHMVVFYIAALAVTLKDCRTIINASILGSFVLILTCFFFGSPEPMSGRFIIPSNVYLSNPNDLAVQLLVGVGLFLFLIRQPGRMGRIVGVLGALGCVFYLLKTGSRGGMLAGCVMAVVWIVFSEKRLAIIALSIPALLGLLLIVPGDTLHRISLIALHPDEEQVTTVEQEKAVSSQVARTYLLKKSVEIAIANPIFGVGPGEFADALEARGKREGHHEASIGTHNTYTQIAAECGIPAMILFVAALVITIRSSFRLYRATAHDPSQQLLSSLAFFCFLLNLTYSIDIFFHHMAYYGNMPLLLGVWIATDLAARHRKAQQLQAAMA